MNSDTHRWFSKHHIKTSNPAPPTLPSIPCLLPNHWYLFHQTPPPKTIPAQKYPNRNSFPWTFAILKPSFSLPSIPSLEDSPQLFLVSSLCVILVAIVLLHHEWSVISSIIQESAQGLILTGMIDLPIDIGGRFIIGRIAFGWTVLSLGRWRRLWVCLRSQEGGHLWWGWGIC